MADSDDNDDELIGTECRPKPAPRLTIMGSDQMRAELFKKVSDKRASLDYLESKREEADDKLSKTLKIRAIFILILISITRYEHADHLAIT